MNIFVKERKATHAWASDMKNVMEQIIVRWQQDYSSTEELARIEGILDVNTIEFFPFATSALAAGESTVANDRDQTRGSGARGFFPITSFASHSCVNNAFHRRKPYSDSKHLLNGIFDLLVYTCTTIPKASSLIFNVPHRR